MGDSVKITSVLFGYFIFWLFMVYFLSDWYRKIMIPIASGAWAPGTGVSPSAYAHRVLVNVRCGRWNPWSKTTLAPYEPSRDESCDVFRRLTFHLISVSRFESAYNYIRWSTTKWGRKIFNKFYGQAYGSYTSWQDQNISSCVLNGAFECQLHKYAQSRIFMQLVGA